MKLSLGVMFVQFVRRLRLYIDPVVPSMYGEGIPYNPLGLGELVILSHQAVEVGAGAGAVLRAE